MATPTIAIQQCKKIALAMIEKTQISVEKACRLIEDFSPDEKELVEKIESEVDKYEDKLGTYLVKISRQNINESDSRMVSELLHIIGDIERISDHSVGIANSAMESSEKKIKISENAIKEINIMTNAVEEILKKSKKAFDEDDIEAVLSVEVLEHVIDKLTNKFKKGHIDRLKLGKCTIEQGFIIMDIITSLERISDHCANVAECVAEIGHGSLGMHAYVKEISRNPGSAFDNQFKEYMGKYGLEVK
jgi:phosphate:Na+ symporter